MSFSNTVESLCDKARVVRDTARHVAHLPLDSISVNKTIPKPLRRVAEVLASPISDLRKGAESTEHRFENSILNENSLLACIDQNTCSNEPSTRRQRIESSRGMARELSKAVIDTARQAVHLPLDLISTNTKVPRFISRGAEVLASPVTDLRKGLDSTEHRFPHSLTSTDGGHVTGNTSQGMTRRERIEYAKSLPPIFRPHSQAKS